MKAKTIIPIAVVLVLVAVVLVGNSYIGKRVEKAISMSIYRNLTQSDVPILVNYDDISVNPLARKISFEKVKIGEGSSEEMMRVESFVIVTSWGDFVEMVRTEYLEDLDGVKLNLRSLDLPVPEADGAIRLERLDLRFDGPLSEELLQDGMSDPIPIDGRAQLHLEGLELPRGLSEGPWGTGEAAALPSRIDRVDLDVDFQPDKGKVDLRKFELEQSHLSLRTSGEISLTEEGRRGGLRSVVAELDLRYTPGDAKLPLALLGTREEASLGELSVEADIDYTPDRESGRFSPPKGNLNLKIKDVVINLSSETRREMQLGNLEAIEISDIEIDGSIDKKALRVKKASLRSKQMKIDGELEIDFSGGDPENAPLRKARLRVKDIDRDLLPLVRSMEDDLGERILDGDEMDLRWEGTLDDPELVSD
jgi:hypothetical protein